MFELLHTDARRRANLRQDLTAILIAAGLLALCLYAIVRMESTPVERRAAAAAPGPVSPAGRGGRTANVPRGRPARSAASTPAARAPAAAPGRQPESAAPTSTAESRASSGAIGVAADERSASASPSATGAAGAVDPSALDRRGAERGVRHSIPPRVAQGASVDVEAWVPDSALRPGAGRDAAGARGDAAPRALPPGVTERTELALEPAGGERDAFAVERLPPDTAAAPSRGARGAAGDSVPGAAPTDSGAAGTHGRWRVTARSPGTHRVRLVAVDVRDSAGRVDTTAWRAIAHVDVPVEGEPLGAAGSALEQASRAASRVPLRWIVACVAAFALGWLLRGAWREPPSGAPPEEPGVEYR